MTVDFSSYKQKIERCEAAIRQIRAAIRAGDRDSQEAHMAFETLMELVDPILWRKAGELAWISPAAVDDAHDAMYDRLIDHLFSTTFPSMEEKFGAYLVSLSVRILQKVSAKYHPTEVSGIVERLDAPMGESDIVLHEVIEDPGASIALESFVERETLEQALAQLPLQERRVFESRAQGLDNNEIARRLGVSPATATRLYQRAIARLEHLLQPSEGS